MSEQSDNVDKLYDDYNKLDAAKEDIAKFESHYVSILSAAKGSSKEKRLASQLIAKFFVHFPQHHESAIDALLDLCEDEDITIRRQAIKELPSICRDRKEFVPKIADVLAQLLQTEDQTELTIVNHSLLALSKFDAKGFLGGLFSQIIAGEDVVRERSIKFLKDKLRLIPQEAFTKEIEEFFLQECRKVMNDVTKDEFITFMTLLSGLRICKTVSGHQTLLEIIKEQAELGIHFEDSDFDFMDKLIMCMRHAIPFFSQFVPSSEFVSYVCIEVIPHMDQLVTDHQGIDLDLYQLLAEMVPFVTPNTELIDIEKCHAIIFDKMLHYMPLPPEDMTQDASTTDEPSLQLTHVESLLYSFHQMGKHNQQFLSDSNSERVKDFKLRLQYLARGVQSYISKLRKHLAPLKGDAMKSEDNKLKLLALKTTTNINTLIRDLFKIPPNYKAIIQLSWKTSASNNKVLPLTGTVSITEKDNTPLNADDAPKNPKRKAITAPEGSGPKRERKLYEPPSGKFSANVKRGGFRFRGRGNSGGGFTRGGRRSGRGFSRQYRNSY